MLPPEAMPPELVQGTKEEGVSFGQGSLVRPSDMAHKGQGCGGNAQNLGFHQGIGGAYVALSHFQTAHENGHDEMCKNLGPKCTRATPG